MNDVTHRWCVENFNQPIICGFDIVRCVGYGETQVDAYVIVQCPKRGRYWNTAVGGYHSLLRLKGQGHVKSTGGEDWDDLTRLDSVLALNGAPKVDAFVLDIRPNDDEGRAERMAAQAQHDKDR